MRNTSLIDFTLVIPSRSLTRLPYLTKCLDSFFGKASTPEKVEAIILLDIDDTEHIREVTDLCADRPYNTQIIIKERDIVSFNKKYQNHGAQCGSGRFVWALNDECEMTTDDWDSTILDSSIKHQEKNGTSVMYVAVSDDTHIHVDGGILEWGSCFPILSLSAAEAINGIIPPEIGNWGGDTHLFNIFKNYFRELVLDLSEEVKVLHHSHHNGRRDFDETSNTGLLGSRVLRTQGHLSYAELERYRHRIQMIIDSGEDPFNVWKENVKAEKRGFFKSLFSKSKKPKIKKGASTVKVVMASGYFNPIHTGHLSLLEEAAKLGDKLVVIVNSDKQVAIKESTPFMDEESRLRIVKALKCVDDAIIAIDNDGTVTKSIQEIHKQYGDSDTYELIFANGGDRDPNNHVSLEVQYCIDNNIELAYGVGCDKVHSSSQLIEDAARNKITEWGTH